MNGNRNRWTAVSLIGGMLMLSLSACAGDSHLAYGGVGSAGGGSDSGSSGASDGGGTGSSGAGDSGGTGSSTGGGSTVGSTSTSGNQGALGTALAQAQPALVTTGNVALGLSNAADGATGQLASAVPLTAPISGTVVKVLKDTGQLLVNVGKGRTLLLDGAQGVVGDVLTINLGNQGITSSTDGANGAIGLAVLSRNQPQGTLATAGVLSSGQVAAATVNGVANVSVVNVTGANGGLSNPLLNVAVADHQLLGSGNPGLINANLLSGASNASGAAVLTPVTSTASAVTGTLAAKGATGTATGVLTPVTGAINGATGTLSAHASASAGGTVGAGGVLKPVTNTVSSLTKGGLLGSR